MARNGHVVINSEKCKGCELCVSVCPVKILFMNKDEINKKGYHTASISDESKCIGCGNCGVMCPDGAITVFLLD
jgi:2-oxoglutarate ferredoxin oxidoreductase subunit delta